MDLPVLAAAWLAMLNATNNTKPTLRYMLDAGSPDLGLLDGLRAPARTAVSFKASHGAEQHCKGLRCVSPSSAHSRREAVYLRVRPDDLTSVLGSQAVSVEPYCADAGNAVLSPLRKSADDIQGTSNP